MAKATQPVTTNPSRRTVLAGAPVAAAAALAAGAAVNSLVAVAASSAPDDPIFGAIAAYRAAVKAYSASYEFEDEFPEDETADDLIQETCDAHVVALEELLTCRPTTLPGVAALLDLLSEPDNGHDPDYALIAGAIGWDGNIKAAAMELPGILAETIRDLIGGAS